MSPVSRSSSGASAGVGAADRLTWFAWRTVAACLDAAAGFALAMLFSSTAGMFFARRAVITLAIGQPGTWWQGPVPMVLGAFGEVVYLMPAAWLLVWLLDPMSGATLGKRVVRVRVRDVGGGPASQAQRWIRSAVQTAGFSGWTLALLTGRWELAAAATLAAAVVFIGWLAALGPSARALHDVLSGTRVVSLRR